MHSAVQAGKATLAVFRDIFRRGILKGRISCSAAAHFHACRPGSQNVRRKWTTPPPFPGQLPRLSLIKMHCRRASARTSTCCLSALSFSSAAWWWCVCVCGVVVGWWGWGSSPLRQEDGHFSTLLKEVKRWNNARLPGKDGRVG